jgi:hypothetical protein
MSTAATSSDPFLRDAIAMMHQINHRLLAGRLSALRLTWRNGAARVDCRVLDGEVCAALAPADGAR